MNVYVSSVFIFYLNAAISILLFSLTSGRYSKIFLPEAGRTFLSFPELAESPLIKYFSCI